MKNQKGNDGRVSRAAIFFITFLAAVALLAYFFYPAILSAGGRYLAPAGTGNAEAVILEGTEVVKVNVAVPDIFGGISVRNY